MEAPNGRTEELTKEYPWLFKETADGSGTLYNGNFKQYYHSIFGARQETHRVFIELGLRYAYNLFEEINLLEVGFGTGFNAWSTALECTQNQQKIIYTGLEPYPIATEALGTLTKTNFSETESLNGFTATELHFLPWNKKHVINEFFSFQKQQCTLQNYCSSEHFHLVYYDSFAPVSQPELWTVEAFRKVADLLVDGGILTTYCAKGFVQRNLKAAGFQVERHSGPPRKREVIRAILR